MSKMVVLHNEDEEEVSVDLSQVEIIMRGKFADHSRLMFSTGTMLEVQESQTTVRNLRDGEKDAI